MADQNKEVLVQELIDLIQKGNAHASFEDAVAGVSLALLTTIPDRLPYNIWQLIEHIRIAQWDIVEFCIDPNHQSPKWPDEYWPTAEDKNISQAQLDSKLKEIAVDRQRFIDLLKNPSADLYTPFAHGSGQNLLREALLIADHNAYHTGEIIVIRRLLNNWK